MTDVQRRTSGLAATWKAVATRVDSWIDGPPRDKGRAKAPRTHKAPLYPQLLRLRNIHPNAWQRAVLGEGMALLGALLALADVASAWSILILPAAVALVVKAHDLLAGHLRQHPPTETVGTDSTRT